MATTCWNASRRRALASLLGLTLAGACVTAPPATAGWCGGRCRVAPSDTVVVAYGAVPRRDLTMAVGSVVVRRGDAAGIARVEQLLDGRIAGVDVRRVGDDYAIRIRGGSSLVGGGDPLVVVDGVPFPRGGSTRALLAMLDPADVARIDVLKDAGATAAYGMRGSNGVILISTRRGQR